MKLFNSFEEIAQSQGSIFDCTHHWDKYWAHIHPARNPEQLLEHIQLVNKYALKLIKEHGTDIVVDKLIASLLEQADCRRETGEVVKQLFFDTITFHDIGKINPNFQAKRLENEKFSVDNKIKIDSQHSRLSAYLYLNYHLSKIDKDQISNDDEKVFLKTLCILFANSIFLHHSSSYYHEVKLDATIMCSIRQFLSIIQVDNSQEKQILDHEGLLSYFNDEWACLKNYFPLFALLKLNFSLLTASDYLATTEFMLGLPVTDFGVMNPGLKELLRINFYSLKSYNRELFERFDYYRNLPFSDLQDANPKNLNLLRQKLTAEALFNVRNHANDCLFYLEAPTGAGKTNLSLALAIELLMTNQELNKIFYVSPATTIVTQTFNAIKETLGLNNSHIIQLHSRAGFHQKGEESADGYYGNEKLNFIDNLFIHYPICLLTHIRFFDILKNNNKEKNYILHRLSNSVVIFDELQSYNPLHWDKIIFFLSEFAQYFNIRCILMSATLPYIDDLLPMKSAMRGKVIRLIQNKNNYFLNPNFGKRVQFNYELLQILKKPDNNGTRKDYLIKIKDFLHDKSEAGAKKNNGRVRVIIEFVKKKSASEFFRIVGSDPKFKDYRIFLISGEILEPRRREIIGEIKSDQYEKILVVSTQVIEAGVDIDMDIGFKDKSIADSDEQLAGRVNRNATKMGCIVYLFDFDDKSIIYGKDERYKIKLNLADHQNILETKNFQMLYDRVKEVIKNRNENVYLMGNFADYVQNFRKLNFDKINNCFELIEDGGLLVYVPLPVPAKYLEDLTQVLESLEIMPDGVGNISGLQVWEKYESILQQKNVSDFFSNQILLKQIGALLSRFTFSMFVKPGAKFHALTSFGEHKHGYFILSRWELDGIYSYEAGLNMEKVEDDIFL